MLENSEISTTLSVQETRALCIRDENHYVALLINYLLTYIGLFKLIAVIDARNTCFSLRDCRVITHS